MNTMLTIEKTIERLSRFVETGQNDLVIRDCQQELKDVFAWLDSEASGDYHNPEHLLENVKKANLFYEIIVTILDLADARDDQNYLAKDLSKIVPAPSKIVQILKHFALAVDRYPELQKEFMPAKISKAKGIKHSLLTLLQRLMQTCALYSSVKYRTFETDTDRIGSYIDALQLSLQLFKRLANVHLLGSKMTVACVHLRLGRLLRAQGRLREAIDSLLLAHAFYGDHLVNRAPNYPEIASELEHAAAKISYQLCRVHSQLGYAHLLNGDLLRASVHSQTAWILSSSGCSITASTARVMRMAAARARTPITGMKHRYLEICERLTGELRIHEECQSLNLALFCQYEIGVCEMVMGNSDNAIESAWTIVKAAYAKTLHSKIIPDPTTPPVNAYWFVRGIILRMLVASQNLLVENGMDMAMVSKRRPDFFLFHRNYQASKWLMAAQRETNTREDLRSFGVDLILYEVELLIGGQRVQEAEKCLSQLSANVMPLSRRQQVMFFLRKGELAVAKRDLGAAQENLEKVSSLIENDPTAGSIERLARLENGVNSLLEQSFFLKIGCTYMLEGDTKSDAWDFTSKSYEMANWVLNDYLKQSGKQTEELKAKDIQRLFGFKPRKAAQVLVSLKKFGKLPKDKFNLSNKDSK